MTAFLTGSYAYGTPTDDSDIDLVVRVGQEDVDKLVELAEDAPSSANGPAVSLRFGKLNLICCMTDERFAHWQVGNEAMKRESPTTRNRAVAVFKHLFYGHWLGPEVGK